MRDNEIVMKIKQLRKNKHEWLKILVIPILVVCLTGAKPEEKKAADQTWTSLTGHQIVAEFVEIKGENLVLKGEDGAEYKVRLPMLVAKDQARAKELEEKRSKDIAQTSGSKSNRLPIFTSGPGKGSYAVYKHENFTAEVDARGFIAVQCLEDGKAVGKPLRLTFFYNYYRHGKGYLRSVENFDKFPAPTLSPTLLRYEMTLQDEVTSVTNYEFVDNTIQAWGWVIDPSGIKQPTYQRIDVYFRPSHTFPPEMYVNEQKKILEPYTLIVNRKKEGITRFPYGNAVPRLPSIAQEMSVEGPIFGKRKVSVSIKSRNRTTLDVINYPNYAPYQGYTARLKKETQASKSDNERLIITID